MVERLENWPMLLSGYLKERHKTPFEWGVNDCMSFVAKAVEALTGEDFFQHYSDYTDEESAKTMLENNGGAKGIITACLGNPSRSIMTARRGDVVIVRMPQITGGIVDDSGQRIALVTPEGLTRVPLNKATHVWSY